MIWSCDMLYPGKVIGGRPPNGFLRNFVNRQAWPLDLYAFINRNDWQVVQEGKFCLWPPFFDVTLNNKWPFSYYSQNFRERTYESMNPQNHEIKWSRKKLIYICSHPCMSKSSQMWLLQRHFKSKKHILCTTCTDTCSFTLK